jgi:hypothetical protein
LYIGLWREEGFWSEYQVTTSLFLKYNPSPTLTQHNTTTTFCYQRNNTPNKTKMQTVLSKNAATRGFGRPAARSGVRRAAQVRDQLYTNARF